MKVLALNSRARSGGGSKTELMLNHLIGPHEKVLANAQSVQKQRRVTAEER